MVIEFIVRDRKCAGNNLATKIDDLREQGHIDEPQKEILHQIRKKGNAGAHELAPMTTRELIAGMGVVDLLIEKLYNAPARSADLIRRANLAFKEDKDAL